MKKTTLDLSNKHFEISYEIRDCTESVRGLKGKTFITVTTPKGKVKGMPYFADVARYTDQSNSYYYDSRIADHVKNTDLSWIIELGNAKVFLNDNDFQTLQTAIKDLKEKEAVEKNVFDKIKEYKINFISKKIEETENYIAKGNAALEKDGKLMTDEEYKAFCKSYSNVVYEGERGLCPEYVTKESYDLSIEQLPEYKEILRSYENNDIFTKEMNLEMHLDL